MFRILQSKITEKSSAAAVGKLARAWYLIPVLMLDELLLHHWIGQEMSLSQLMTIMGFALCAGSVLSFPGYLLPGKAQKVYTTVTAVLLAVLFMAEFFCMDAFHTFMKPSQMISGAGGVATGFRDVVYVQIRSNLGKIALILTSALLYGLFCIPRKECRISWGQMGASVLLAAAGIGIGMAGVQKLPGGTEMLKSRYDFNTCMKNGGMVLSMAQELSGAGSGSENKALVIVPTDPTVPAQTEQETVYGVHTVEGLDFAELAAKGQPLFQYINSLTPESENAYTGLFAGKNLILITAEAFSTQVLNPELTPTLCRMSNEGIRFTEYYQPLWNGSTTGGELSIISGLVPEMGGGMNAYAVQRPFNTLGRQLMNQGYFSRCYHNNDFHFYDRNSTHERLGYEKFMGIFNGMEEGVKNIWPQSDLEMIDFTVPQFIGHQPFSVYYITVSGHSVYTYDGNAQARKNWDTFADTDYSDPVKCYLAANMELEKAMTSLIARLEAAGIAEDTVIVLSADHYPYGLDVGTAWGNASSYLRELYGVEDYDDFIRDRNTLIIWSGCLEGKQITVDAPTSSLDILNTVSNLFGLPYDSRLSVGRDVFGTEEAIVLWPNFSWVTELGTYYAPEKRFTPRPGVSVPEGYVERINTVVQNKINYSHTLQSSQMFVAFNQYIKEYREKQGE